MADLHTLYSTTEDLATIISGTDQCSDFFFSAVHELSAFTAAVRANHGEAAAERAAEYWMDELDQMIVADRPAKGETPNWRQLSVLAASRLANETLPKNKKCLAWPCHSKSHTGKNSTGANDAQSAGSLMARVRTNFYALAMGAMKDLILISMSL